MPIDKNQLRQVMGHFATGVSIITTLSKDGELVGLTANALTSVSLVPPLLLICVDKKAESYPHFAESNLFTVNVLAADQEDISRRFATSGGNKFEGVSYRKGANGAPILNNILAFMECRIVGSFEGGDHTIYLGEIEEASTGEGEPLLFYRGGYRSLGS
ncbi:MAG TPA: flavin reductase family protein [Candidatus Binataceae bacterium]|nr:flavin reductase family protein [Candidatus Binataceae bacterium]